MCVCVCVCTCMSTPDCCYACNGVTRYIKKKKKRETGDNEQKANVAFQSVLRFSQLPPRSLRISCSSFLFVHRGFDRERERKELKDEKLRDKEKDVWLPEKKKKKKIAQEKETERELRGKEMKSKHLFLFLLYLTSKNKRKRACGVNTTKAHHQRPPTWKPKKKKKVLPLCIAGERAKAAVPFACCVSTCAALHVPLFFLLCVCMCVLKRSR